MVKEAGETRRALSRMRWWLPGKDAKVPVHTPPPRSVWAHPQERGMLLLLLGYGLCRATSAGESDAASGQEEVGVQRAGLFSASSLPLLAISSERSRICSLSPHMLFCPSQPRPPPT